MSDLNEFGYSMYAIEDEFGLRKVNLLDEFGYSIFSRSSEETRTALDSGVGTDIIPYIEIVVQDYGVVHH